MAALLAERVAKYATSNSGGSRSFNIFVQMLKDCNSHSQLMRVSSNVLESKQLDALHKFTNSHCAIVPPFAATCFRFFHGTPGLRNAETGKEKQPWTDSHSEGSDDETSCKAAADGCVSTDLEKICEVFKDCGGLTPEAKLALRNCGVIPRPETAEQALSRFMNDWKASLSIFEWCGCHEGFEHSLRAYHSMVAILGRAREFRCAWIIIREMHGKGLVSQQTLFVMMRRYSAAKDVGKAVKTFENVEKFGLKMDLDCFHGLLGALCRYGNVEDAEKLLYQHRHMFEYETKTFNIVLDGWCNRLMSVKEGKRFWKNMLINGIEPDVFSYSSMICCLAKAGGLSDVLRMFDAMKQKGCVPDIKVYNSVVYALANGKCTKEAYKMLNVMKQNGVSPNHVTYNCLIKPLCKAKQVKEAYKVFEEMLQKGHFPSIRTLNAFVAAAKTPEECLDVLHKMRHNRCSPNLDAYTLLLRKFSRWRQHNTVAKLWNDIKKDGLCPDRDAYTALIHGHFLNGKIKEAYKYYEEMKSKGFSPEPMTDRMLQAWVAGNAAASSPMFDFKVKLEKWESNPRLGFGGFRGTTRHRIQRGGNNQGAIPFRRQNSIHNRRDFRQRRHGK